MNKKQCKQLTGMIEQLEKILSDVRIIGDEEESKFDDMTENAMESDAGMRLDSAAQMLEQAADEIEDAVATIQEVADGGTP